MDTRVLARAGGGLVVVTALAAAVGPDYDTATANGVRYFHSLGAAEVRAAPDARRDEQGAYRVCAAARLLVLPGGSPARLLAALTDTAVGRAVTEVLANGGAVSGASAGAMVLGGWTMLPERDQAELVPGLGVVPWAVVVPHFRRGSSRMAQLREELLDRGVGEEVTVLGLPEQSGLLIDGAGVEALGSDGTHLLRVGSGASLDLSPLSATTWPPPETGQ